MSSATDSLMLLGWLSISTQRASVLVPILPPFINALTTFFRAIALLCLLPVLILALSDVLSWLFFKLILRPLGYASTIRFKDPEPNVYVQHLLAVKRFARRRRPHAKQTATTPVPVSTTTANSLSRSRSRSKASLDDQHNKPPVIDVVPPPTDDSSASDSSASSSPILSYSNLSSDPNHALNTPATSAEQSPDSAPPSPDLDGSNALGLSPDLGANSKARGRLGSRPTSANSSTSSLVSLGMTRQRAGSVGVDGPLVELEETASSEEEGLEEGGAVPSGETSEDEQKNAGLRRRNLPKGGPAFGFTEVGAKP